jgi:hypothetical protein
MDDRTATAPGCQVLCLFADSAALSRKSRLLLAHFSSFEISTDAFIQLSGNSNNTSLPHSRAAEQRRAGLGFPLPSSACFCLLLPLHSVFDTPAGWLTDILDSPRVPGMSNPPPVLINKAALRNAGKIV